MVSHGLDENDVASILGYARPRDAIRDNMQERF